jgi:hypothetical protein
MVFQLELYLYTHNLKGQHMVNKESTGLNPEEGESMFLQNVGIYVWVHTVP